MVREGTDADVPALVALVHAAFAEYEGRLDPPSGAHAETEESIRRTLRTARAVIAFAGEAVAGCVFCRPEEGHLYVFRLAVLPAYQGLALGRVLMGLAEELACSLGLPRIRLGVRTALDLQRAWYERLGYRPVAAEAHPGYREPTYLVLEKTVTKP
jgi:ribosomal protein S18 acetylase RimI-like enzyme